MRAAEPDMPDLLYEKSDHVAVITLNRPERLNAISFEMLEGLRDALADADRDTAVRAIILTGAGRGFCSGLDLKDAMAGKGIGGAGALAPRGGAPHMGPPPRPPRGRAEIGGV
jgi:enoyl-CoA hydratase/carnithine racemase